VNNHFGGTNSEVFPSNDLDAILVRKFIILEGFMNDGNFIICDLCHQFVPFQDLPETTEMLPGKLYPFLCG
jgi:hypothetical protein